MTVSFALLTSNSLSGHRVFAKTLYTQEDFPPSHKNKLCKHDAAALVHKTKTEKKNTLEDVTKPLVSPVTLP